MPLFYLHIHDGIKLIQDPDGTMFSGLDAARLEALASARDLLADMIKTATPIGGWRIEIMNHAGRQLATVPLKDAIVWSRVEESGSAIGDAL